MNVTSLWKNTPRTANILIIHTFLEIGWDIHNYTAVKMNRNNEFQFSMLNHVNMAGELFLWNTDFTKLRSQINVFSPSNKAESSANKHYGQEREDSMVFWKCRISPVPLKQMKRTQRTRCTAVNDGQSDMKTAHSIPTAHLLCGTSCLRE